MKKHFEIPTKGLIFVSSITKQKKIVMKFSELTNFDWREEKLFENFLENNPRFKEGIIVRNAIQDNFGTDYQYERAWTVQVKNRTYNIILNDPWRDWGRGRKQKKGFIFKRVYGENEPKITRERKASVVENYQHTSVSVERSKKFNNDCQIWTLAKVCGVSYDKAAEVLLGVGWTAKRTNYFYFPRALDVLGFETKSIWKRYTQSKGCTLRHINKIIPAQGVYAVTVKGHILCVVDAVIYDSCFNPNARVEAIMEIFKI